MQHVTCAKLFLSFFFFSLLSQLTAQTIGNPPAWNSVKRIGGSGADYVADMALDAQGNTYLAGTFNGTMTIGSTTLQSAGLNEAFIAKLDPSGSLLWVQTLHSDNPSGEVFGQNIAVDNLGNVYVSGYFKHGKLLAGNITLNSLASQNLFAARLTLNGTIVWAKGLYLLPGEPDSSLKLLTDDQGDIYCKSTLRTYKLTSAGLIAWTLSDVAITDGTITWGNGKLYYGGTFNDVVVIGGKTLMTNFSAVFICEVDPLTGAQTNARVLAESNASFYDIGLSTLYVKSDAEIYAAGNFYGTVYTGSCSFSAAGGFVFNTFLLRANASTCDWLVCQADPNAGPNKIWSLQEDANGALWAGGDWNTGFAFGGKSLSGGSSGFLAKIDPSTGAVTTLTDYPGLRTLRTDAQGLAVGGTNSGDAFWGRLDTDGAELQKNIAAGESGFGILASLELDNSGVFLSARVSGPFQLGGSAFDFPEDGLIVAKLNHAGDQVLWHNFLPTVSSNYSFGNDGFLDKANGKFYCVGSFTQDFQLNGQTYAYQDPGGGGANYLLLQVDAASGAPGWVETFSGNLTVHALCVDRAGNIVLSGIFSNELQLGNFTLSSKGDQDFFLAKLNSSGQVLWAQRGGGTDVEYLALVATDAQNNIYFTGEAYSLDIDFNDASVINSVEGDGDIVLAKYNAAGELQWSKLYGNSVIDPFDEYYCFPAGFAVDDAGNAYMTGISGETNYIGPFSMASPHSFNHFAAKFDSSGAPLWATPIRTERFSPNYGELDFDAQGNLYCGGTIRDTTWLGNTAVTLVGTAVARNAYYARFNGTDGTLDWATILAGSPEATIYPTSMALFAENNLLVGGYLTDRVSFGNTVLNTASGTNGYLALLGPDIVVATHQSQAGTLELTVFPNPATDYLQWQAPEALPEDVRAALLNSAGQTVGQGVFPGQTLSGRIELQNLPAGVYYLRLTSGNRQTLRKVVVE